MSLLDVKWSSRGDLRRLLGSFNCGLYEMTEKYRSTEKVLQPVKLLVCIGKFPVQIMAGTPTVLSEVFS
jgi:hypothetical protein